MLLIFSQLYDYMLLNEGESSAGNGRDSLLMVWLTRRLITFSGDPTRRDGEPGENH